MPTTTDDDVLHGLPRIEGTRISVLYVYDMVVDGETDPARVADALNLSLADVYEAIAYYYHSAEEMRSHRHDQEEARDELRERTVTPPVEPDGTP